MAIDLKIDTFKAEYKGQMELYLRWLDKNEKCPGEKSPIGLILCAGKNDEHVKPLELAKSNIRVATYMTELPPRDVLEAKFHQAIEIAHKRMAQLELASGINLDGGPVRIGGDLSTPEPSCCLLMVMGIAALGLRRVQRKRGE